MRILAYTDLHGNLNVLHKLKKDIKEKDVDIIIDSGDVSVMGNQLRAILTRINTFKKPVFIIHGNHEGEEEMRKAATGLKNINLIHGRIIKHNGWFIGGFATSGLREVYEEQEGWVKAHQKELKEASKSGRFIWVDHAPPAETNVDELDEEWHAGSKSLRKFIEEYQPTYVFCGHIHEAFGREDIIGKTVIINPGPMGKIIDAD